jgi:hypothetical protein
MSYRERQGVIGTARRSKEEPSGRSKEKLGRVSKQGRRCQGATFFLASVDCISHGIRIELGAACTSFLDVLTFRI